MYLSTSGTFYYIYKITFADQKKKKRIKAQVEKDEGSSGEGEESTNNPWGGVVGNRTEQNRTEQNRVMVCVDNGE